VFFAGSTPMTALSYGYCRQKRPGAFAGSGCTWLSSIGAQLLQLFGSTTTGATRRGASARPSAARGWEPAVLRVLGGDRIEKPR
jgi:hypothetical protein